MRGFWGLAQALAAPTASVCNRRIRLDCLVETTFMCAKKADERKGPMVRKPKAVVSLAGVPAAPVNPAANGELAEKVWACLCRNKAFLIEYRRWRVLGESYLVTIDGFRGHLVGVLRAMGGAVPASKWKRGERPPIYALLPAQCRELIARASSELSQNPMVVSVTPEAEECALVYSMEGLGEEEKGFSGLAGFDAATVLGLKVATLSRCGYRLFAAPRPSDPEHLKLILAKFKKSLEPKRFSKSVKCVQSTSFMGTSEQWRDYVRYEWFRDRLGLTPHKARCAVILLAVSSEDGSRILEADWSALEDDPTRVLNIISRNYELVTRRHAPYDKRIVAIAEAIETSFETLFPVTEI